MVYSASDMRDLQISSKSNSRIKKAEASDRPGKIFARQMLIIFGIEIS